MGPAAHRFLATMEHDAPLPKRESGDGPFEFGTKAETLARLQVRLDQPVFCDQLVFSVNDWRTRRTSLIERCLGAFEANELVVRSSAVLEDGADSSMAGAFRSVVGVARDPTAFANSVESVIASYGDAVLGDDQVLVQPRISDVAIAGVILTRDLDTGAPYYVINYDDWSGRTDGVTSGAQSKTVLVHRSRTDAMTSDRLRALVGIVRKIEAETSDDRLDIEFCITTDGRLYIVQVRPLATRKSWGTVPDHRIDRAIDGVRATLAGMMRPREGLHGRTTMFGQMPDWNPAEMIGSLPKTLSYSLYARLVTDGAWAEARYRMGYRDMRGRPLMVRLAEQPYIDVRLSLNSFLPAALDEAVGARLVDAQLERLAENREHHDKIEFEIAFPNFDFRFDDRARELVREGVKQSDIAELRTALVAHTVELLRAGRTTMAGVDDRLTLLAEVEAAAAALPTVPAIGAMLEGCIRHGIVPFAEIARHAFIGISFLKSLVHCGAFEEQDAANFLSSVDTIAHELVRDMAALSRGDIGESAFLGRYGHLRPGTYDITSFRYDERPDLYLGTTTRTVDEPEPFNLSPGKRAAAERLMQAFEPGLSIDDLLNYVREAVRRREFAKFRFTRTVSDALQLIVRWGEEHDLSRADLAHLSIGDILRAESGSLPLGDRLAEARDQHAVGRLVRLPHIMTGIGDVDVVRLPLGKPTYITQSQVTAPATYIATNESRQINGAIVLIESADPGFDWIFSHDIKGLITKFGGANSHMAIRCAEFRLPAAIGCGERLFAKLQNADVVVLDCSAHSVRAY